MKYGERLDSDKYTNGIPAAEFEDVIMKYLPVTAEEIREWAVYDGETQTYAWANLGCGNQIMRSRIFRNIDTGSAIVNKGG